MHLCKEHSGRQNTMMSKSAKLEHNSRVFQAQLLGGVQIEVTQLRRMS